jgi:two-component system sensor histidine kinase RegB
MRDANAINLAWLLTLRWGAIAGQVATILVVDRVMGIALPLAALALIIGVEVLSNVAGMIWMRVDREVREGLLAAFMLADVVLLTALLFLTGGAFNPFSFLYLVNIALAAVVLRPRWTWALVVLSLACFGALFGDHRWLPLDAPRHGHAAHMDMHLQGMWVAFGVAAVFIVYFVQRVTRALAGRESELAAARARNERDQRLASLATLAAGAAHELSTPLSTIAVAAKELERALARDAEHVARNDDGDYEAARAGDAVERVADARLIREQVERCRQILAHMAADAGESAGEAIVPVRLGDIVDDAIRGLGDDRRVRVVCDEAARRHTVRAPARAVAQALRGVLDNARDASPHARVELRVRTGASGCRLEVHDDGPGMRPEVLARAGEPFFTTKTPGEGMGLGLFLTRAVLERLGGKLELSSSLGRGTTTALILPADAARAAVHL